MSLPKEELQKKILEELQKNPITSYACKQVGVARATLYRWLEEDSDFKDAYKKATLLGKGAILDFAKLKLFKLMNSNDERIALETAKYYIDRWDPDVSKRRRTFNEVKMQLEIAQRKEAEKEMRELQEIMDYIRRHPGSTFIDSTNYQQDVQKDRRDMEKLKEDVADEKRVILQGIQDEKRLLDKD